MIVKYDRVRVLPPSCEKLTAGARRAGTIFPVIDLTSDEATLQVAGASLVFPISDLELICSRVTCSNAAAYFVRTSLAAVCATCANARFHTHELVDTRGDSSAIVACACGESLDGAPSRGPWTIGDVVCEYRDCAHCGSSRAYMPAPIVKGRNVHLYLDPETSEISGEWPDFLDALHSDEAERALLVSDAPPATLMRNGLVLARVVVSPVGARAWLVAKPRHERPAKV